MKTRGSKRTRHSTQTPRQRRRGGYDEPIEVGDSSDGETIDPTIVLVYPFAADHGQIEEAAAGLTLASDEVVADSSTACISPENSRNRFHLTIRTTDMDRLNPGKKLNDSIIDFWMQWYVICCLAYEMLPFCVNRELPPSNTHALYSFCLGLLGSWIRTIAMFIASARISSRN
jgi:hypothetical protein